MELREDWHKTTDLNVEHGQGDPFAAAVRWSRMPMVFADARRVDSPIIYANDAFCRMSGYNLDEIVGRNCRFLQGPDTDLEAVKKIHDSLAVNKPIGIDILNYRKDGSTFWNALYISPVFNEAGDLLYFFSSQFDASERLKHAKVIELRKAELETEVDERTRQISATMNSLEAALREKTLLVHEIDHRVKNNLQTISALISMQLRQSSDQTTREVLGSLQKRVEALGTVHRRLDFSGSEGTFDLAQLVTDLVPDIVKASAQGEIDIDLQVAPIHLSHAMATPISLVLNELVSNAVRHAWQPGQKGTLRIAGYVKDNLAEIVVTDDGVGINGNCCRTSVSGLRLARSLVRQLCGSLNQRPVARGTEFTIGVPLPMDEGS